MRKESGYQDRRHPDTIERCDDIIEDAKRREFTIGAIYYFQIGKQNSKSPAQETIVPTDAILTMLKKDGFAYLPHESLRIIQDHKLIHTLFPQAKFSPKAFDTLIARRAKIYQENKANNHDARFLIDPFNGIQDLIQGKLKSVGDPDTRFNEDALRLMRALRFVNVINHQLQEHGQEDHYLDFDKETWKSIQKNYALINTMAKERIKIELDKVFSKGNPFAFVALLDEVNMLKYIFPAVYACKHLDQPIRYHPFDVYHHTIMTLYFLQ
ncbi:MAG: CCA tRNA nucleotidyltransferase [bacterium]|nr:CCA tRNA nucleotidyltransferase [bacterium]